jgi:mannose-6-phosphate isomerase
MAPIRFHPLYKRRVWGGQMLAREYGRHLPDASPYGESWEIVDREDAQSHVQGGTWDGCSLHELWSAHRDEIFGSDLPESARFPLLVKVLDARDDLSIQVHPPAGVAPALGGEPKTEIWYVAEADPGARLYAGLKAGTTRAEFETALKKGRVAEWVHALEPRTGESIFIPSGRLHAIGAGFLIHEIQQNSDTTYRVFDWNRTGLDGKPRDLHIEPSLRSIDFNDYEPDMNPATARVLADCEHFHVEKLEIDASSPCGNRIAERFSIFSVAEGRLRAEDGRRFERGDFFLLPAAAAPLTAEIPSTLIRTTLP